MNSEDWGADLGDQRRLNGERVICENLLYKATQNHIYNIAGTLMNRQFWWFS